MGAYPRLFVLFASLTAIFVVFGWAIGTVWLGNWVSGALTFLVLAAIMNLVAYFLSDKICDGGKKPTVHSHMA